MHSTTTRSSAPAVESAFSVSTKSPFLEAIIEPVSVPVRSRMSPEPRASSPRRASMVASKSAPLAADLDRSAPRAAPAASRAASRSPMRLKPSVISVRNWWSGEPSRAGSSS